MTNWDGMTTNERLLEAGLLDTFDAAARKRDRAEMIDLLTRANGSDPEWIADKILANPERYGF